MHRSFNHWRTIDFTMHFTNVTNPGNVFDKFIDSPKNGETWVTSHQYGLHLYWYKYDSLNNFRVVCNDSAVDFGNPSTPFKGTITIQRQNSTLTVLVNGVNTAYTVVPATWLTSDTTGFLQH